MAMRRRQFLSPVQSIEIHEAKAFMTQHKEGTFT